MIAKCSWCGKVIGERPSSPEEEMVITHGICEECADKVFSTCGGVGLQKFLNSLNAPVFVVDDDVHVEMANNEAMALLGKDLPEIKGYCGGDVFECIHASEPAGCGKTIHCSGCVIRSTVEDTMKTGRNHERVPAMLKMGKPGEFAQYDLEISTQKMLNVVLLRIDEMHKKESEEE